uniref:Uncharacterized protein n=1 Tax=Cacopsylla melanoneura TaxID=428564 RepID=A0A8D8M5R8_9HEMI
MNCDTGVREPHPTSALYVWAVRLRRRTGVIGIVFPIGRRFIPRMVIIVHHIVVLDRVDCIPIVLGSILIVFNFFFNDVNTGRVISSVVHVPSLFIMKLACRFSRSNQGVFQSTEEETK